MGVPIRRGEAQRLGLRQPRVSTRKQLGWQHFTAAVDLGADMGQLAAIVKRLDLSTAPPVIKSALLVRR